MSPEYALPTLVYIILDLSSSLIATMSLTVRFQKTVLVPVICLIVLSIENGAFAMFKDMTDRLIPAGTSQRNYGVAVTNVGEGDGPMEWVIAGYQGPNIVLQKDPDTGMYKNIAQSGTNYENLMDEAGNSIGVCACDIDGDGKEEIYFLNTNNRYSGRKKVTDRLFIWRNNRYENLFEDTANKNVLSMYSGRSVACIDRTGNGKYGFLLATYAEYGRGKFELIEMDEQRSRGKNIVLHSIAESVGINFTTGGRGIAVGPILGEDGFSDIYFVNEGNRRLGNPADNAFYMNDGSGHFSNIAAELNLNDYLPGRGVTLADFNNDQLIDIVYGNWDSRHKLLLQRQSRTAYPNFISSATPDFQAPSPIRTVIAADFDNDGILEVFLNNIAYNGNAPNKLFKVIPNGIDVNITVVDIGDALEKDQHGTGAAVADIDNDGVLELLIAHGESASQALTLYHVKKRKHSNNHFIRIMPTTQGGAPARGSKVTLTLNDGKKLTRIIDGGSGYLCQMEPVAHFGLGDSFPREVKIQWPDGHHHSKILSSRDINKMHQISFYGAITHIEPRRQSANLHYSLVGESSKKRIGNAKGSSSKGSSVSRNTRRGRKNNRRGHRRHERNRNRNNRNRSGSSTSGRRITRPSLANSRRPTSIRTNLNRSGNMRQNPSHSRESASLLKSPNTRYGSRLVKSHTKSSVGRHTAKETAHSGRHSTGTNSRNLYRRYPYSYRRGEDSRSELKPQIGPELTSTTSYPTRGPTGYWQRYNTQRPTDYWQKYYTRVASTFSQPSRVSHGQYPSRIRVNRPQTRFSSGDVRANRRYPTNIGRPYSYPREDPRSQRNPQAGARLTPSRRPTGYWQSYYNQRPAGYWQKQYNRIASTTPKPSRVTHGQYPSRIRVNRPQTRLRIVKRQNSTRVTPSRRYYPSTNERSSSRKRYSVESPRLSRREYSPTVRGSSRHYRTEQFKGQGDAQNRPGLSYSSINSGRKSAHQPRPSVHRNSQYDWRHGTQSSHSRSGGRRRILEPLTMKTSNTGEGQTPHRTHLSPALDRLSREHSRSLSRHLTHRSSQSGQNSHPRIRSRAQLEPYKQANQMPTRAEKYPQSNYRRRMPSNKNPKNGNSSFYDKKSLIHSVREPMPGTRE